MADDPQKVEKKIKALEKSVNRLEHLIKDCKESGDTISASALEQYKTTAVKVITKNKKKLHTLTKNSN